MVRVDLRTVTFEVPPQDVITRDNVPAKVNAVAYFRVVDPVKSVVEVERIRDRHVADRPDDAALGARQGRARHAAGRARAAQREPAADHRRADRAVGRQGGHGRDQGRRHPAGHAARHGPPGRGRARAPRQGHQRRGRVPGLRAPLRRRRGDERQPRGAAAALPADAARDRDQPELDHRPARAHRPDQAAHAVRRGRQRAPRAAPANAIGCARPRAGPELGRRRGRARSSRPRRRPRPAARERKTTPPGRRYP